MFRRSISTTDAAPTPTARARRRMIGSRRSRWAPGGAAGPALAEGGGLADALAQEVELGSAGHAVAHDLDLLDARRVDLESALDADAGAQRAHGDRASDPAPAQAHDRALEDLDALAVALDDLGRDAHGVAGGELGQVGAGLVRGDLVQNVHRALLTGGSWLGMGGRRARDRGSARKDSTGARTVRPPAAGAPPPRG